MKTAGHSQPNSVCISACALNKTKQKQNKTYRFERGKDFGLSLYNFERKFSEEFAALERATTVADDAEQNAMTPVV